MLALAALLFLLPSSICGFKENKNSNVKTENQPPFDVFDGLVIEHDNKSKGLAMKTVNRRELTDDYYEYPLCNDKPMGHGRTCFCGNRTLSGETDLHDGDYYCCVPPSTDGQEQCEYTDTRHILYADARCENGDVRHKTEPCHPNCWNSYRQSVKLYKTATLYCHKEDYCLPLEKMCSGVCSEEAELCDPDNLRCIGDGYNSWQGGYTDDYTDKSLDTKLGKNGYCLKINNDQFYDSIGRADEQKILGTHQPTVNYTGLVKCNDGDEDGIICSGKCETDWCTGSGSVCKTTGGETLSLDHPTLCRNGTFWRINKFSCDWFLPGIGLMYAAGARCSGDYQHCTWPRHGTDTILLPLGTTPPVWTSQTRCLPSTQHADSTIYNSQTLTKHSGAQATLKGSLVVDVIMWMIGLPVNKMMRTTVILMVVKEAVPLLDQIVLPANMKTSSTAIPQDSASTRRWCVTVIHIQAVVGMMKAFIIVWKSTSRKGLSRDMPP